MNSPIVPIFHANRTTLLTFDLAPDAQMNPLTVDISDLLEWVAARDPRSIGHWRQLSAEEYSRSFAIARTAGHGVIRDLYDAFRLTLETGGTEVDFSARVMPILQKKGWLAGEGQSLGSRVKLIYDSNLRVARGAGQWERIQRTKRAFPYLRGVTARDERVRRPPKSKSDHTAIDGMILPVDHPFFSRWFSPLGFRCRCSFIQMTRSQLARWNSGITSDAEVATIEARLGEQIFAPPGSFDQQLATIAGVSTETRLPGQAGVSISDARFRGEQLLQAQLANEAVDEISDLLNRIFGQAA